MTNFFVLIHFIWFIKSCKLRILILFLPDSFFLICYIGLFFVTLFCHILYCLLRLSLPMDIHYLTTKFSRGYGDSSDESHLWCFSSWLIENGKRLITSKTNFMTHRLLCLRESFMKPIEFNSCIIVTTYEFMLVMNQQRK